jgi:hypothetical protein
MTPLLALESAEGYVGGAYLVFLLLLLIYVAIMAAKLARIQRELGSLADLAERRQSRPDRDIGRVHEQEHEIDAVRAEAHREEEAAR